jgi:glycosyltransferase involved in cell wall biosynthesis
LTGVSGVHLHAPALVGMARWPVPVVAVAHSCVGTWWRAMRGDEPAPPDFRWRIEATREGLGRAAAVISPTAAHAEALRAVYGALDLIVVYNGADPLPLPAVRRDRAVLTAGRLWDEAKGVALLDRAAPALDGPVRAAGSVEGPNGARAALSRCELLGILDAAGMARAYAGATVFASMSRYEPFGLAVLEAAQAGLRLVLADIPTFRELWDGVATFVPDEAALPAALQAALNAGPDERPSQRAGRYTLDATVDATLTVHRRLLPARVAVGQVGG